VTRAGWIAGRIHGMLSHASLQSRKGAAHAL
jgi:hypothetical protein